MRKLYYISIRALPEDWVHEDTRITSIEWEKGEIAIIAANPLHPPMFFRESMKQWELYEKYLTQQPHGIYPRAIENYNGPDPRYS